MGRRALSGPPENEYQQPTAWRYPQLRLDIGRQLRIYKDYESLLTLDDTVATHLGIPTQWVYLVRIHEPLPDTLIPEAYWQRQSTLRAKGRPLVTSPDPTYKYTQASACVQLRSDISYQLRNHRDRVPITAIDDTIASILSIPSEWVYLVRSRKPLPDEPIPDSYWQLQPLLRTRGRPRVLPGPDQLPGPSLITPIYHYAYLTTQRPARCVSIIAFSHAQPRNYKPLPSPFLHPTTTRTI